MNSQENPSENQSSRLLSAMRLLLSAATCQFLIARNLFDVMHRLSVAANGHSLHQDHRPIGFRLVSQNQRGESEKHH